jgi:acetyl esterase/lipase
VSPGTHPPFDQELKVALDNSSSHIPATFTPELIETFRQTLKARRLTDDDLRRGGQISFEEIVIPRSPKDSDLGLLVCRSTSQDDPAPACVYYIHSGGMVLGDNRTGMMEMLDWVEHLGVVVVSVDYRLAPEHPFPAAVDDCYAGLLWTAEHGLELAVDTDRLLVAGASAGGGLAAAMTLIARDRRGPRLLGQVLMCPMLDDRNETPSSHELIGEGVWDRESNLTGWTALLGVKRGATDVSPYAAPARATDLSGLPPAFIDVGSVETFRDEDIAYACRIWQAGGQAELHVWPGGFHGFDARVRDAALSVAARQARLVWLKRLIGAKPDRVLN